MFGNNAKYGRKVWEMDTLVVFNEISHVKKVLFGNKIVVLVI